jgi:hypothetical protein
VIELDGGVEEEGEGWDEREGELAVVGIEKGPALDLHFCIVNSWRRD